MGKELTVTQVKNQNRVLATEKLREALEAVYGAENVYKVGDSEFSVYIGDSPTGEEMYVNYSPTVKEYADRQATKKTFKAYNGKEQAKAYETSQIEKAEKQAEKSKLKSEKIARDEKYREKQKEAREKARREKAEKQAKKAGS